MNVVVAMPLALSTVIRRALNRTRRRPRLIGRGIFFSRRRRRRRRRRRASDGARAMRRLLSATLT